VPFSWYEPMWLENLGFAGAGEGWRLTEAGETAIGGRLPVNPSGGVLSSAALQVMGKAGAHQVDGARVALGHAYGGGSQYFAMWIVASTLLALGVSPRAPRQPRAGADPVTRRAIGRPPGTS
jgi:acetyl-CoA C-acetyltransferase